MMSYGALVLQRRSRAQSATKRVLDVLGSALLLVVFSPVLGLIAAAIKLGSPGPVLYRWPVVGKGGIPLRAFKFRTMTVDADARKRELLAKNEASGPVFKMRDDPRVTSVGRLLRKYGLDELPQLWTVLVGGMSLVGPRPVLISEWVHFEDWQRRKLSVKPGIICLWHVRGQPRVFEEWIKLDLEYIDRWSLWLDLTLLLRAPAYILSARNY
jgi:lipopolysaccharide/colanic/teichoic acid biosynthesis glycosyltransferase